MTTKIDRKITSMLILFGMSVGAAISGLVIEITLKLGGAAMASVGVAILVGIAMVSATGFILYTSWLSNTIGLGYAGIITASSAEFTKAINEYKITHGDENETD